MSTQQVVSREEWIEAVKRRLGTSRFELLECKEQMLVTTMGSLGEYRIVDVTVRQEEFETTGTLHFFFKCEPVSTPERKELTDQIGCFQKEVDVLNKLFVQLRSALKDNGNDMEWTCKCFYTRPDVIVLENLSMKGFRIVESIGLEHCVVALKTLANLHAASLIFEETRYQQPYRLDSEYSDVLAEIYFIDDPAHTGGRWLRTGRKAIGTLVELIHGKEYWQRARQKIEAALKAACIMEQPSKKFRNVVHQGDTNRYNMFFRYEEDVPVEAMLIDFQLARYGPPASELMSFFYLNTDRALRDEHMPQLLSLYYDHLCHNLKQNGLEPEQVLSRREFDESCDYYKVKGILMTCHYLSTVFHKRENLAHVESSIKEFLRFFFQDRTAEVIHSFKTDDFYRRRVTQVIGELIEECVNKEFHL